MTGARDPNTLLLVTTLLLTGACLKNKTVFIYSIIGDEVLLPCPSNPSDCAAVSWSIYKTDQMWKTRELELERIPGNSSSSSSSRISITPDCSLIIRQLNPDDACAYVCQMNRRSIVDVYLSLLAITSPSSVTDLRPGGTLSLSCVLYTYYNAGSCRSYSNKVFTLSWAQGDGAELIPDKRHKVIVDSPCNVTLSINLQREDHNKKWRCLANAHEPGKPTVTVFQDIASTLLLHTGPQPEETVKCVSKLPISHIVLCVALPLMVAFVGFYTWKVDRQRHRQRIKTRTSRHELKEMR